MMIKFLQHSYLCLEHVYLPDSLLFAFSTDFDYLHSISIMRNRMLTLVDRTVASHTDDLLSDVSARIEGIDNIWGLVAGLGAASHGLVLAELFIIVIISYYEQKSNMGCGSRVLTLGS